MFGAARWIIQRARALYHNLTSGGAKIAVWFYPANTVIQTTGSLYGNNDTLRNANDDFATLAVETYTIG